MFSVKAIIETTLLTKRSVGQVTKLAASLSMQEHRGTLGDHFEADAVRKYGYKLRTRRYQIRKAKTKKHQKPLVWSGELRNAVLTSAKVQASQKGAELRARGSRKSPLTAQFRKELEAFTPTEESNVGSSFLDKFIALASSGEFQQKKRRSV